MNRNTIYINKLKRSDIKKIDIMVENQSEKFHRQKSDRKTKVAA